MRLTLRTLLAYLDNTLDPESAEALREKIAESGFATQLVQRIGTTLSSGSLPAPSPEAKGPVEEANVIGEFLDSTLPHEQVAEIERACLESDPHLAEAAACHQILTIVLAQPAEVSSELRKRIYELPERRVEDIAASGSFSSVAIPDEKPPVSPLTDSPLTGSPLTGSPLTGSPLTGSLPTADTNVGQQAEPVRPVGVSDSGVSDAPTRLRQAEAATALKGSTPAIAGSRARSIEDARIYGGSIRPARVVPWLITLALLAVLGFSIVKIFNPVLNQETASVDGVGPLLTEDPLGADSDADLESDAPTGDDVATAEEVEVPAGFAPAISVGQAADRGPDESSNTVGGLPAPELPAPELPAPELPAPEALPAPEPSGQIDGEQSPPAPRESDLVDSTGDVALDLPAVPSSVDPASNEIPSSSNVIAERTPEAIADAPPLAPNVQEIPAPAPTAPDADTHESEATAPLSPPATSESALDSEVAGGAPDSPLPLASEVVPPPASEVVPPSAEVVQLPAKEIAKIVGDDSLVAGWSGSQWVRLKQDAMVTDEMMIACAPSFRAQMEIDGATITIIGPANVTWLAAEEGPPILKIDYGRVLIVSTAENASVGLQLGPDQVSLGMDAMETVIAASHRYFRPAGFDPLVPDNRTSIARIMSVQGSVRIDDGSAEPSLTTGQQRTKRGTAAAEVSAMEAVPDWIDAPDPSEKILEAGARKGLVELLNTDQPLEIALREATLFRQAEVGALAGRTLLNLGQSDIYFGSDGILSNPKQRSYWSDHFADLVSMVDRSADSAQEVKESIESMDAPNTDPIFRMLTGFSQTQLVEGADEELVQLLDSPSMAVRVLAIENLHKITGTTLYFRAEQENEARRDPVIKKWVARLRKGDIRWEE